MHVDLNSNYLKIPVFIEKEGLFDISSLNFVPLGLNLYRLESTEFKHYIEEASLATHEGNSLFDYNYRSFKRFTDDLQNHNSELFVAIPVDPVQKQVNYADINNMLQLPYHLMQIICPSRFGIKAQVEFEVHENGKIHDNGMTSIYTINTFEAYPIDKIKVDNINDANLIISRFRNYRNSQPFKSALESYITSFNMTYYSMQFLNLLMCFESLIVGPQELSYRLKRGVSVMCGVNLESCKKIFKNLGKCYDLRSKIVHGEEYNLADIHRYIPYLISLASRYLIEFVSNESISKTDLNNNLNVLGFGMRNEITNNRLDLIPNLQVNDTVQLIQF